MSVEAIMMSDKQWGSLAGGWSGGGQDLVLVGAQVGHGAAASQVKWWILSKKKSQDVSRDYLFSPYVVVLVLDYTEDL